MNPPRHDRMTILDLSTGKVISPDAKGPLGHGLRPTDKNNFAPRFGFAYRVPGRTGLIARGGYGISYIEEFGGNGTNPIQNQPNAFTQDLAFTQTRTPQALLGNGVPLPGRIDLSNPFGQFRMIAPDAVAAYVQSWDLSLQREWSSQWMLDVAYVGAKGTNLLEITDPNQPVPGTRAINPRRPLFAVAPNITTNAGRSVGNSPTSGDELWGELPWLKRSKLGGWQLSGITTLSAGNPCDLFMGNSTLNTGTTQRPDRIADGRLDGVSLERYFDLAAFRAPAPFVYGNSGRNILRGPGLKTWNIPIIKDTKFSERLSVQWRTDFFNALNTTQFNPPGNSIGTPQAGRIRSTRFSTNRQVQFVMKAFF